MIFLDTAKSTLIFRLLPTYARQGHVLSQREAICISLHVGPSLRKESFVALGDDALSCLRGIRIFPADDTEGRDLINLDLVLIAISGGGRERERERERERCSK